MKKLVILSGPTAVGKTALSIELAKRINGEIISADSMQVYRGMDIGTAKIREEEMQGVRHHLIDIISPFDEWSVSTFKDEALKAAEKIWAAGKIPILVGGTGFYIQALLYDVQFTEQDPADVREKLAELYEKEGAAALHKRLSQVDPASAQAIHENNVKRVMRALEYFLTTGEKISEHNEEQRERKSPYNFAYFVLTMDRSILYERIDKRVDLMMEEGLLDEVRRLKDMGCSSDMVSMKGLGYKEIISYLDGEHDLEEAVRILKRDTRHFAKRQLTWFRREKEVTMIDKGDFAGEDEILEHMLWLLGEKGII
ncbi:MAG: tRNA (adenosine(37)-N6)-dimethylallyltransferase MiaA [Lachnospiraceae bacterium]|nr:tRNA (adenosine(37)-N6)-dimethylallyltransferase MiaA [Lachnospiraceae bacterium]